ncbi:TonB-dependent receptor domain-containing protein [Steroidobacter flavus]|uniref:TonB-dependent receptor domain-containing protein n=1 Tax=Steroidobacter flavus TaxID=1842136 RepID=A0ABV8T1I8_9GAMM
MSDIVRAIRNTLCLALASASALGATADAKTPHHFQIASGQLADSLEALSEQSGTQIMYEAPIANDARAPALNDTLSVNDALDRLLAQTDLRADRVNDRTVVLRRVAQAKPATTNATSRPTRVAVAATEPTMGQVEVVTVTARKREERLQDVPASIAAASAETLSQLNMVSVTELDAVAPGLTFVTNPSRFGSGPAIALRGISTQTQGSGVQDSVAIVIDGVVYERAKAGAFPELSDTERVEVLRGPQGTLFGKNASAGVISITTKDPTEEFVSEAGLGYSDYNTIDVRGSMSGSLVDDRLTGRISAYRSSRDGYVENIYDNSEWEDDEQTGFRGKLVLAATDSDQLKLSTDYVEQKNGGGANIIRAFTPQTPQYVIEDLGSIVGLENDKINARSLGENRQESRGAALQWDHALGGYDLTTLVAYRAYNQDFHAGTYTWLTPRNDGDQFGYTDQDQYSAEIRIASPTEGPIDYVAGLYLLNNETEIGLQDPGTLVVGTTTRQASSQISNVEMLNYAAFAEATAEVTDRLSFTAGLRWTHDEVDMKVVGFPIAPGTVRFRHPLGVTQDEASASKVSWRAGAQWRAHEDRMFYVSAATGFKGPGFNVNIAAIGDSQPVRPETSISYEAGMKSQFFNRRVTLNLNAFVSTFEDFQTQGGLIEPSNPNARIVLLNAGKLKTQGFEAEFAALVSESLEFGGNAAYVDATYDEFANAQCYPGQPQGAGQCVGTVQDLSGERLPNSPRWNFNVFTKYQFPVPGIAWDGFATLDYSWRDSIQWNPLGSPYGIEPSYGLLGASIGMRTQNDHVNIKLYGKNLTDQFHTSGIVVGQVVTHFLPPDYRRIVGIDVSFSY